MKCVIKKLLFGHVLVFSSFFLSTVITSLSASFQSNAYVEVTDPTGGLSWNTTNNSITVQCWFKLSIPSGTTLSDYMTILVNRRTGGETDRSAYPPFGGPGYEPVQ